MKCPGEWPGRLFILQLEDGDIVHEVIEQFDIDKEIEAASLIVPGGADDSSQLVVGPREYRGLSLEPMQRQLENAHKVSGAGTLFRDDQNIHEPLAVVFLVRSSHQHIKIAIFRLKIRLRPLGHS